MRSKIITERDMYILQDVLTYRYLTGSQIERLHFATETGNNKTMRNRRLQLLVEKELLRPIALTGIHGRVFMLTKKGTENLATWRGVSIHDLEDKPPEKPAKDYFFFRHFSEITDFRIALRLAMQHHESVSLRGFIPEYRTHKSKHGFVSYIKDTVPDFEFASHAISHIPDGVLCLQKQVDDQSRFGLFFLELDRGTEALNNPLSGVLKLLRFYVSYVSNPKHFERYADDFRIPPSQAFRLLLVTTSETRMNNMIEVASNFGALATKWLPYLWITYKENITPEKVCTQIWRSMDKHDSRLYSII